VTQENLVIVCDKADTISSQSILYMVNLCVKQMNDLSFFIFRLMRLFLFLQTKPLTCFLIRNY